MIKFTQTEQPLYKSDIIEIEKFVGLELPYEYKKHLLEYNGGQCYPNTFSFNVNGKMTESNIDWFLAIYSGKYDNLKEYINLTKKEKKRLPKHILPIAHDSGGNLICISCGAKDYGYVYFWDHENEVDYNISNDDDYSNLYFIAKDLNTFFNGLR